MWDIVLTAVMSSLAVGMLSVAGFVSYRNHKVGRLRSDLLARVGTAADEDIHATPMREFIWRYDTLRSVTYGDMVMSLKPIKAEAFYPDTSFLYSADIPIIEEDP
jgi:hypothetical protein